jgi:SPP1 gp7 family putative phage head morphogenesis protein
MNEEQYQERYIELMQKLEKTFSNQIRPIENSIFRAAAKHVEHGYIREADVVVDRFKEKQVDVLMKRYIRTAMVFGSFIDKIQPKKKSNNYKEISPAFWLAIRSWAKKEAAQNVSKISTTQKQLIAQTVFQGIREGKGNKEIARDLRKTGQVVSRYRANMIARTETHNAAGKATEEMARGLGVAEEKKWLDSEDERVRSYHRNIMNGDWIKADDPFIVDGIAMDYPGDSMGGASNVVNCRCVCIYRKSPEMV